jgi:sensor c-di-GMP phosphodiesterase-like protein
MQTLTNETIFAAGFRTIYAADPSATRDIGGIHGGTMSVKPANLPLQPGPALETDSPMSTSQDSLWLRSWIELLLLAALMTLGAASGWWVSSQFEATAVERNIEQSTTRVLERLDDIVAEARLAFDAIEADGHAHCSDEQLLDMRTRLFEARYLRDIGGIRGFSLYCSTALGILDEPYHSTPPPIRLADGTGLRTDRSVLASQRLRTVVVEYGSFNALVDSRQVSDLVTGIDQAHIELAVDDPQQRDWHPFSLLTRPERVEPDGRLSDRAQCSEVSGLCVRIRLGGPSSMGVASQHWVIAGLGAALGASLFMMGATIRRQRNTPDRALARAISDHDIQPYYQPIVALPGGHLVGFEALARWVDDQGHLIPTEKFIALAERNGMIGAISQLMIRAIGDDIGDWLAEREDLRLSINISPQEFCDPELLGQIQTHLIDRGVRPAQIVLEITERTMIEIEAAQDIIERMTSMGLEIHADDFGVGYCGLAYLNELDIHGIKISQQLTAAVATDSPKASLVPRVIEMARGLGLDVVVEGVETKEQREALRPLEPIMAQGWLFSRELGAADLERFGEDRHFRRRMDGS